MALQLLAPPLQPLRLPLDPTLTAFAARSSAAQEASTSTSSLAAARSQGRSAFEGWFRPAARGLSESTSGPGVARVSLWGASSLPPPPPARLGSRARRGPARTT